MLHFTYCTGTLSRGTSPVDQVKSVDSSIHPHPEGLFRPWRLISGHTTSGSVYMTSGIPDLLCSMNHPNKGTTCQAVYTSTTRKTTRIFADQAPQQLVTAITQTPPQHSHRLLLAHHFSSFLTRQPHSQPLIDLDIGPLITIKPADIIAVSESADPIDLSHHKSHPKALMCRPLLPR